MLKTIGIIGTGRFATVLKMLVERSPEVIVMHSSTSKPTDNQSVFDLEKVMNCDVAIIAIPISALETFLKDHARLITMSPLVVDVCSVKVMPATWMKKHLPKNVDILATHPLFGPTSTKQGTEFSDLKCVFSPIRINDKKRCEFFASLFTSQGISIQTITSEEHDRLMARTQAMSFLFGHLGHELGLKTTEFDTAGFRSLLANQAIVAADSHALLVDLFHFNPFATEMLTTASDILKKFQKETL